MVWLAHTESSVDVSSLEALLGGGKPLLQAVTQLSSITGFHFRVHVYSLEERERECVQAHVHKEDDSGNYLVPTKLAGVLQTQASCGKEEETRFVSI